MSPNSRSWLPFAAAIAAVMVLALVAILTLRGPLAGRLAAAPSSPAQQAGSLRVTVTPTPASPRVGENELDLRLADSSGAPVDDAEVHVSWKMAAMGAMSEMRGSAVAEPRGSGEYRAGVDLAMNGTWRLEIDVRPAAGEAVRLEGSLTTGTPGVALAPPPGAGAARPEAAATGEIRIDAERRQRVGIRTTRVERGPLELSVRAYNCLKTANIRTIADLVQKSEPEMLKYRNFGRKSLKEIQDILGEMGLHFGMDISRYREGLPLMEAER